MTVEELVEILKTEPDRISEMEVEGSQSDFDVFTNGFTPELKARVLKVWKFTGTEKA